MDRSEEEAMLFDKSSDDSMAMNSGAVGMSACGMFDRCFHEHR